MTGQTEIDQKYTELMDRVAKQITIKDRLSALVDAMLSQSSFNAAFLPVIKTLVKNFLKDTPNEAIEAKVRELRDRIIPWLLGEVSHEDQNRQ